jgi:hypothetical protein
VTNLAPLISSAASMTATTIVDLTTTSGLVGSNTNTAPGTGSATNNLPANVALVISEKIARRYRGGHPRMYLTGQLLINVSVQTNWTPAWVTTASTAAASWRTAINALSLTSMPTIQLVNLSYYTNHLLRPTPTVDVVTAMAVHSRIDTMRRRLGKEIS